MKIVYLKMVLLDELLGDRNEVKAEWSRSLGWGRCMQPDARSPSFQEQFQHAADLCAK